MDKGYDYKPGTKLSLELTYGEKFAGHVLHCEDNEITMRKVYDCSTSTEGTSNLPLHFYRMEIRNITVLEEVHVPPSDERLLSIYKKNHSKLDILIRNYIYITEKDNSFNYAIECIQLCSVISIAALVTNFSRNLALSLLGVGTRDQVFVFDLKLMGPTAFENGLKEILESYDILKVVHICSEIADALYHQHDVTLRYVFDTQVADRSMRIKEKSTVHLKPRLLKECLWHYFDVSESVTSIFFINFMRVHRRPVDEKYKLSMATQAVYLLKLKELFEAKMLIGFNVASNFVLNVGRNASLSDSWKMNSRKILQLLIDLKPKPLEYRKPLFTKTRASNEAEPQTSQSASTTEQVTQLCQSLKPLKLTDN